MDTPTLRPVSPSTPPTAEAGLLDAAMETIAQESLETDAQARSPSFQRSDDSQADMFEDISDTELLTVQEDRASPPCITQAVSSSVPEYVPRVQPRYAAAQGSAGISRPTHVVYHPTPIAPRPLIPYPQEIRFEERRPAKRHVEALLQQVDGPPVKRARERQWTRPVRITTSHQSHLPRVYDDYATDNASAADPRAAPASQRLPPNRIPSRSRQPLAIPLDGHPDHAHRDHSSAEEVAALQQAQAIRRARRAAHSLSSHSSQARTIPLSGGDSRAAPTDIMSGRDSRASAFSQASVSTQATYESAYSADTVIYHDPPASDRGDHPPTGFGRVHVPRHEPPPAKQVVHEEEYLALADALPIYGPVPFDCPLADIELPSTEPMDVESGKAHPKVKLLVDAIYLNPLSKDKLADMYKKYPRPIDLETLHKTRLNEDLARQLANKSRESVVLGDLPLQSLQWSLQFLARPLVDIATHLVSGEETDAKYIVSKVVDALKLTAKASWKANDLRRGRIYAGLKGAGLEVAQAQENHTSFKHLLGNNPRDQILARQREDEFLRDVVAAPRSGQGNKNRQGNGQGGHNRGRQNQKNSQSGRRRQGGGQGGRQKSNQDRARHQSNGGGKPANSGNRGGKNRGQGRRGGNQTSGSNNNK